jgi:hypothetical protein
MRTSSTKNSLIIGISIVLGASLLSVGVSNAAGSSIKACAKKSNGAMRLIDVKKKCKKSERTLTWGTQGDAGAAGATGAAGSNGLSSAYLFTSLGNKSDQSLPSVVVVSAPNLPAGSYVWSASVAVSFINPEGDGSAIINEIPNYLACSLNKSDDPSDITDSNYVWPVSNSAVPYRITFADVAPSDNESKQAFTVSGAVRITEQASLYLMCEYEGGLSGDNDLDRHMIFRYPTMTFTKVNEILPQG